MLIRERIGSQFINKVYRTRSALWFPLFDAIVRKNRNVLAVLRTPEGALIIPGSNLITDAGDLHYAQRAVSEALTNAFGVSELASATPTHGKADVRNTAGYTIIASTEKAHSATYPKRNDADADNTGAGVDIVTFLASYTKGDFNAATIVGGIITNATPGAAEPLLTGYDFAASFGKTADDTLKVFVNHTMSGV